MKVCVRMAMYLSYKDRVVYMRGCNAQITYDYINYASEETFYIESVVFNSNLNNYALKT